MPLTGPLRARLGAVARDPCTYADLRWMVLYYLYGWLGPADAPALGRRPDRRRRVVRAARTAAGRPPDDQRPGGPGRGRVEEFLDALGRVAAGGTALDTEVVTELLSRRRDTALDSLTPREREVLHLMAQGRDNTSIADTLVVTERAVSKHIGNIFLKLGLPQTDSGHRRVLAVLAYRNNS